MSSTSSAAATTTSPFEGSTLAMQRWKLEFCVGSVAELIDAGNSTPAAAAVASSSAHAAPSTSSSSSLSAAQNNTTNTSSPSDHFTSAQSHRLTHRWACFLRPTCPHDVPLWHALIRSVTFRLDRSFPDPVRVLEEPPFCVDGVAWAEHFVEVSVAFADGTGLSPFNLSHLVWLRPRMDAQQCPLHLTAAHVISTQEPPKALVLSSGVGNEADGAQCVSERFDSFLIVHLRRRTFEMITEMQRLFRGEAEKVRQATQPIPIRSQAMHAVQRGRRRVDDLRNLADSSRWRRGDPLLSPLVDGGEGSDDEASRKRGALAAFLSERIHNPSIRRQSRERAIASLYLGIETLQAERDQTLVDMRSTEAQYSDGISRCAALLCRLETRCKRMRVENDQGEAAAAEAMVDAVQIASAGNEDDDISEL